MSNNWQDGLYSFKQEVRAPFLHVYVPKAFKDPRTGVEGALKYSATLLIQPTGPDIEPMKAVMTKVISNKWPGGWPDNVKSGNGLPVKLGSTLAAKAKAKGKDGSIYEGFMVMAPRTLKQPELAIFENGKVKTLDTDVLKAQYKNKFYGGCYVLPVVHFTTYEGFGGGVTAYLQGLVWVRDGQRTGGVDLADAFKDFVGRVTPEVDPTGGATRPNMDNEIPF